jgi:hypothetical protein
MVKISKAEKLRQEFRANPDADPVKLSKRYKCVTSMAYAARLAIRKEAQEGPRARKEEAKPQTSENGLIGDVKIIQRIGVDRVRAILELL